MAGHGKWTWKKASQACNCFPENQDCQSLFAISSKPHCVIREMGLYAKKKVARGAAEFLTAMLEYLTAKILELSGDTAFENKKQ